VERVDEVPADPRGPQKTYAVIFDVGDEVMSGLERFAREQGIDAAQLTAIGAFSDVVLAYFDWESKEYERHAVEEQVEVLSLIGDVATHQGEPKVHAHVVVGRRDTSTRGGHLMEAHVRPTLEVILTESPAHLRRRMDERSGLPLVALDASSS
jgi:predicted DNA-binding protein with PD1-like motif